MVLRFYLVNLFPGKNLQKLDVSEYTQGVLMVCPYRIVHWKSVISWVPLGSTQGDNDPFCITNVHVGLRLPGYHWGVP